MTNRLRTSKLLRVKSNREPLMQIATMLAQLYSPPADREAYLRDHGSSLISYIALNQPAPVPGELHAQLSAITPARKTYIYFALKSNFPDHYLLLHRTDNDLWELRSRRILALVPGETPAHDGLLVTLADPEPLVAVNMALRITRLLAAGPSIASLNIDLADLNVKREFDQCILTSMLFSDRSEITAWTIPGKAIYHITKLPEDPYIAPIDVECIRTRQYATSITRPRVIVWANCDHTDYPDDFTAFQPRHIVPQVKDATPATDEDDPILAGILTEALLGRLMPFLAVQDIASRSTTIYGLSYDPERKEAYPALYLSRRTSPDLNIPAITRVANTHYYAPNPLLVRILAHHAFPAVSPLDDAHNLARWQCLRRVMGGLGYARIRRYPDAFHSWNRPLTSPETLLITTMATRLQEPTKDASPPPPKPPTIPITPTDTPT